jgi:hypothetical protein
MEICGTVVGTTASDSGGLVPKSPYPDLRAFRCFLQELQLNVAVVPEIKSHISFFFKTFPLYSSPLFRQNPLQLPMASLKNKSNRLVTL